MSNKSRRDFLTTTGVGVGGLALSTLVPGMAYFPAVQAAEVVDPLATKQPHFPAKAKSVIWLHMDGAPSTLDLYDYKPELIKLSGQDIPASFLKGLKTSTQGGVGKLYASKRTWGQHGESGAWFSDLVPNLAQHADKIAFIKSSTTVGATHDISILKLNTGDVNPGRPSLGAWVSYALGSLNQDLPTYVVLYNDNKEPSAGSVNWSSGFLPAVYQGTTFRPGDSPILHLDRPANLAAAEQRSAFDLLKKLNEHQAAHRPEDSELAARIRSYDLAYRMETSAPEAVDLSTESDATKEAYGLNDEATKGYGTNMLRARRLIERGVRFVHVVSGPVPSSSGDGNVNWDAHTNLEENHGRNAKAVDKPIAALLADLAQRGLLDQTLVVWTSEFGRTSYGQSGTGRDHNPWGYTQWLAGGGVKAGTTFGETDEVGLQSQGKKVDTYDLHATILNQLGLDHLKVTFLHDGRSERPTVVFGDVVRELIA
jgi:hypothetical protein